MSTNHTDIVDALRAAIGPLQAELAQIESAAPTRSEMQRRVAAFVERAAAEGNERLRYGVVADELHRVLARLDFPLLAALLGPDVVGAVLCKPLDEVPKGTSAAQRTARVAEIRKELDALERAEEAAIVQSEQAGTPIARRGDARPEIVLAIVDPDADEPQDDSTVPIPTGGPRLVPAAEMPDAPRMARVARSAYMQREK